MNPIYLGVNIDHVATLRQARGTFYPDPLEAMFAAEKGGADGITLHLREDRRHIQVFDVERIQQNTQTRLNLEMAVTESMLSFAEKIKPMHCCFVPEKRAELTTEGGLDVLGHESLIRDACQRLMAQGIEVSLFVSPDLKQIEAAKRAGASVIELNTGTYAEAETRSDQAIALEHFAQAVLHAKRLGLKVNAGHGLHNQNVQAIAALPDIHELNIGHAIVAQAIFVGIEQAVRQMKQIIQEARS